MRNRLLLLGITVLLLGASACDEPNPSAKESAPQQIEIEMPTGSAQKNFRTVGRITASFGDPIVISAYNLEGNLKWEQKLLHKMSLFPRRITPIDYNKDGRREEILLQISGNVTKPGTFSFGAEAETFIFLIYASDGSLLHQYQCAHILPSYGSIKLEVPRCSPQEAVEYYQQMIEYYGGNKTGALQRETNASPFLLIAVL